MDIKKIKIIPIKSVTAREFIKKHHYSGKICQNSQVHFGCIYEENIVGVLQYGPSTDKRRMATNLNVGMNEFLELNRMAMVEYAPKNSESRCISVTLKILKKQYPFLKVIISFADACQCGDGTIYRASGFDLIDIKKNNSLLILSPEATKEISKHLPLKSNIISDKALNDHIVARKAMDHSIVNGRYLTSIAKELGARPLLGFQFKYAYFFDKELRKRFNLIPFIKIPDHCKMYKGNKRVEHDSNAAPIQGAEDGATPIDALQLNPNQNYSDEVLK